MVVAAINLQRLLCSFEEVVDEESFDNVTLTKELDHISNPLLTLLAQFRLNERD